MPAIRIDYDDGHLSEEKIRELSEAIQRIVAEITGIEDTFVYAQSPTIKIKVAPIEVLVQMSKSKIENTDILFEKIKDRISQWKQVAEFNHPINLTLMPMEWKFEVNI
jgi:hypothetical protein